MDPPSQSEDARSAASLHITPPVSRSTSIPALSAAQRVAESHRSGQPILFDQPAPSEGTSSDLRTPTSQPLSNLEAFPPFSDTFLVGDAGPSSSSADLSSHHGRRRERPKRPPGTALGLEEEVVFGWDEDLIDDVGEIIIPPSRPLTTGKGKNLIRATTIDTVRIGKKEKLSRGLADSELVLESARGGPVQQLESGKIQKGFMGSLKRFGKKKEVKNPSHREGSLASEESGASISGSGPCETLVMIT